MEIPVYLFTGFLEAGKTKFIQETLEDSGFNKGEKMLLLVCEEGEEEYDMSSFSGQNVTIATLEDKSELTAENLEKLRRDANAERVLIEYNGMWMLDELYKNLPEGWIVYQEMMFADANTFENYKIERKKIIRNFRRDYKRYNKNANLETKKRVFYTLFYLIPAASYSSFL